MPSRTMRDGWHFLGGVSSGRSWVSVTAARNFDHIGVVAAWDYDPATKTWALSSWGCTEDHAGNDTEAAVPFPEVPPMVTPQPENDPYSPDDECGNMGCNCQILAGNRLTACYRFCPAATGDI